MAGPAIRAVELARALARHYRVTVTAPFPSHVEDERVHLLETEGDRFGRLLSALRHHDVVIAQQLGAQLLRHVQKLPIRYVADLYVPATVELLEAGDDAGVPGEGSVARRLHRVVLAQCTAADFVICASERQRDLWIGGMSLSGLIDVQAYRLDPTYRAIVDVVPFGLSANPPVHRRPVLKGVWPGIGPDDQVLLWGGGIWPWLDAITPIRAVERLAHAGRRIHLFFMGMQRPTPSDRGAASSARHVMAYAREHNLDGTCVHFNPGWVPYDERQNYLLEADLGVSAHRDHLESRYSFRSRILDYLWAGLPMVLTRGDPMAESAEQDGLGVVVEPEDVEGFARACAALLDDRGHRTAIAARMREAAKLLTWEQAAEPLIEYCRDYERRPAPRHGHIAGLTAIYGQYPGTVTDLLRRRGVADTARRVARHAGRALRHGL
jgi:glycosyltransferase involved in cell wall biosynthesis